MTYFRELPDIQYENFLDTSRSSMDYITLKNLFLRADLFDFLKKNVYVFDKYEIREEQRPDQIAEELYGSPTYDWVVILVANIINYQDNYPLTSQQLYEYVVKKYDDPNAPHHFESTEVRDSMKRLIYPAGLVVAEDFTIPNPDIPTSFLSPVTTITNWEYETRLNDAKKEINVLRREYLNQFVLDMREIATYGFNSEYVNETTIRASNSKTKSP